MKLCEFVFLAVAGVLCVFAKPSLANPMILSEELNELAEIEKVVTDPNFQNYQDAIINASGDKDSLLAKAALEAIRKEGDKFKASDGPLQLAAKVAIEGVMEAVRLVAGFGRKANTAIDNSLSLMNNHNKQDAIDSMKKELRADRELIFIAGVPIHDAQGSALALSGGAAIEGLKQSIVSIQKSGTAIFEIDELADEMVTLGIKAGGIAAEETCKGARKTISAGLSTVYKNLNEAAKHAIEGLQFASIKGPIQANSASGIVDSLKTQISTNNSAALEAIARLNTGMSSLLKGSTNKTAIDAAKVMHQGLLSTILETCDAISVAKKAIAKAAKLADQDPEAAIAAVRKGMRVAEDEIFYGSAPGYLGLGAAGQMCGKIAVDKLIPAVLEIEYGRVSAFEDLALAERTACVGFRSGGDAAMLSAEAANQICDAAGITLFQDFADGGEIGFDVFRSL